MAYVLLLALIALGVPLALSLRDRVDSEVRSEARSQADLVAATAPELVDSARNGVLQRLATVSSRTVRGRVIVVDSQGRVVADSAGGSDRGASYADRPEISSALSGTASQQTRHSNTLSADILATAVPVVQNGHTTGAVRITQSVDAVHRAVRTAILDLALLGGVVLLLGVGAGALIARQIARPIRRLDLAARTVAEGDLEARADVEGSTEQRSLARAFNDMTGRLSRMLRGQQEFVADASHQLRTPLTGLRLRLEALREGVPDTDPAAAELDAGMHEVDRLSEMVDELLVLSRAGERESPAQRIDLIDAARRAVDRWAGAAAEQGSELVLVRPRQEPGATNCSGADLDRVLDVLIENAVRYSGPGKAVQLSAGPGRIEVFDQGPGLAAGEEESVFERFFRGRAGRQGPDGTGLGLPIARELAREWGGEVSLSNLPEGGLQAIVEMPRVE